MNIVIDQGNTNIKAAVFEKAVIISRADFKASDKSELINWMSTYGAESCPAILSSVTRNLPDIKLKSLLILGPVTPVPVVKKYASPETLGNDRLANAVGASRKFPGKDVLVIDVGTCIKYDLVSSQGEYLGGNISPGIQMRFRALHEHTAKLPLLDQVGTRSEFGTDTTSSIIEGVFKGAEHEINGFIHQYSSSYQGLTIIMTGGDMKFFELAFKNSIFADPDLTLFGLNEILTYNLNA